MGKVCGEAAPISSVNGINIERSKPCHSSNYNSFDSRNVEYIVMHYTGNTKDNAKNNANYFMGANREASAHYFVDDDSIWQSVDVNNRAWHCGTSKTYYHDSCRNANSIGIEMCCTAGNYKIGSKALEHSAHLAAELCKYLNITDIDKYVVRHYDVTHKNCPAQMVANNGSEWVDFKNRIKSILSSDKLYRVRKTKDDAKSQKGAYANLSGAITCCQSAGDGYHVFDWNGNIVYSYIAPVETIINVYDLEYPNKVKIVEPNKVFDAEDLKRNCAKAVKLIMSNNGDFNVEIAKAFFDLAPKYGINPAMAISQSILETGWFNYQGSAVKEEQHNYCGMGVVSNGVAGNSFDTIEDGVRAQLQHLYAYGCSDTLPDEDEIIDPRFKYVTRGIAPYWQNLAGRWSVPGYDNNTYSTPEEAMKAGNTYGQKIIKICADIEDMVVTDDDIKKLFESNDELKEDISYVFRILRKILEAIISVFKCK